MGEATKVLEQMGGKRVTKAQAPFYYGKVERLACRAKMKMPQLYVIPERTPNACAVSTSDEDTAVAVTTGLMQALDEDEIDAVLAHEIGHIQKGHSIEKTKIAMKAMAISTVAAVGGDLLIHSDVDFTPDDDDTDDFLSMAIKIGIGVAASSAGSAVAANMMSKNSFASEFEADECGATLSRKPWALSRALQRLESLMVGGEKQYAPEVSQLFIVSPTYLQYETHPPTKERMDRLAKLEVEVQKVKGVPTIFCPSCGIKTDEDGKFCYWCGVELATLV